MTLNPKYYDGTKLLSTKDLDGNTPEIFMVTSNRTAGKTTFFNRMVVNKFLKRGKKFGILFRYDYELSDCATTFFKDIGKLFFQGSTMTSKGICKGKARELYIDNVPCGYALALNNAEKIKRYSHLFNDVSCLVFDEFQSECNDYCTDEVKKFQSIHTSVARGEGEQVRYVPVYMIANPVTILNPYYVEMGISYRLNSQVKFLKGNGFVLEQGYNESASLAQKTSGFNKAFAKNEYQAYSSEGIYLNDNYAFVEKPEGKPIYLATIRYKGRDYAIKQYLNEGIIYCDDKVDNSFKTKISITTNDHNINYVMLKSNDIFFLNLRYYFQKGCFRFKDLKCKEVILTCLSY